MTKRLLTILALTLVLGTSACIHHHHDDHGHDHDRGMRSGDYDHH